MRRPSPEWPHPLPRFAHGQDEMYLLGLDFFLQSDWAEKLALFDLSMCQSWSGGLSQCTTCNGWLCLRIGVWRSGSGRATDEVLSESASSSGSGSSTPACIDWDCRGRTAGSQLHVRDDDDAEQRRRRRRRPLAAVSSELRLAQHGTSD